MPGTTRTLTLWLSVALVALTVAVFAPVRDFGFVSWDDPGYVTANPMVSQGLTPAGIVWALTSPGRYYWHPVTWLSHMTDVSVFGLNAGAHHLHNLALHVAGTLLLFLLLIRLTGQAGRSAFVVAIFAVHPVHVESVAWIAERKDMLSGVFWMLTLWAYVAWVRKPGLARYAVLMVSFALGLMSKPMLVTLPIVLLLVDVWPLGRLRSGATASTARTAFLPLVIEKLPLFALAAAASVVTFLAESHVGGVQSLETLPVSERVSNAVVALVRYIGMAIWPADLAVFYPFRPLAGWLVFLCALILAGLSFAAVRMRGRAPYLFVGWWWYVVTLLPVIGLIQVGSQARADRFLYLPLIGLLVALAWGVSALIAASRINRTAIAVLACAVVAVTAAAARAQVSYWKDSETLWRRAVDVVPNNDLAHANLGLVLAAAGRTDEALPHFAEAVRIVETSDPLTGTGRGTPPPEYASLLHTQLGLMLARQGRWPDAITHFREAVRVRPDDADGHSGLSQALASAGDLDNAIRESRDAVRLAPERAELRADQASILYRAGDVAGAIAQLQEAVRLEPRHPRAATWHYNLAAMFNGSGRTDAAVRELEAALAIDPAYKAARQALNRLR